MAVLKSKLRPLTFKLTAVLSAALAQAALFVACSPGSDIDSSTAGSASSGTAAGGNGGGSSNGTAGATSTSSFVTSTSSSTSGTGGTGGAADAGDEDGGPMPLCPPDEDMDDIPDEIEGRSQGRDTDNDGTPDYQDTDSDNDTIPDKLEGQTVSVGCTTPQNSDSTDVPDYLDLDSDNNGLPDRNEIYPDATAFDPLKPPPNPADSDTDNVPDYADPDNDGDSLPDTTELAGGTAVDTDSDGIPDLDDIDSDGDTIADSFEGLADPDGDMVPAFRDGDSDDDSLSDICEAGPNHMVSDVPPDHDNDGKYDSLDLDSDGDGILDADEDANLNCTLDPGETDRTNADTDGDGTTDFIEVVLGSDPRDPMETPGTLGKYYFVLPYLGSPIPAVNIVPLRTQLNQGDVAFIVDTTATMGGEINNLKTAMMSIIAQLKLTIPDLAVGVAGFDDFPTGNYGAPGVDLPFYISGATGTISSALANNLAAVQALNVHDGGDFPESHVAAMHRALSDYYLLWDTGQLAPSGAPAGRYGSLQFRTGALPILVGITDASFHNGRRSNATAMLHDPYSFNYQAPFPTPTIDELVTTMKSNGAHFIGISASDGSRNGSDPYEDMAYLVDQVGSYVPTSAFGGINCGTGLLGSFIPPDGPATVDSPGGTCRLIFDISTNGNGLSASVQAGVTALLKSIRMDLRALAAPDMGPIDAVDTFIESVAVNAPGGNDEAEPGVPCLSLMAVQQLTDIWSGPKGLIKMQDGINETALGIVPSQKVCFKVIPKPNTMFPQTTSAQVFKAVLTIKAKNGASPIELVLGSAREILFVVPPAPQ